MSRSSSACGGATARQSRSSTSTTGTTSRSECSERSPRATSSAAVSSAARPYARAARLPSSLADGDDDAVTGPPDEQLEQRDVGERVVHREEDRRALVATSCELRAAGGEGGQRPRARRLLPDGREIAHARPDLEDRGAHRAEHARPRSASRSPCTTSVALSRPSRRLAPPVSSRPDTIGRTVSSERGRRHDAEARRGGPGRPPRDHPSRRDTPRRAHLLRAAHRRTGRRPRDGRRHQAEDDRFAPATGERRAPTRPSRSSSTTTRRSGAGCGGYAPTGTRTSSTTAPSTIGALHALREKYEQYRDHDLPGPAIAIDVAPMGRLGVRRQLVGRHGPGAAPSRWYPITFQRAVAERQLDLVAHGGAVAQPQPRAHDGQVGAHELVVDLHLVRALGERRPSRWRRHASPAGSRHGCAGHAARCPTASTACRSRAGPTPPRTRWRRRSGSDPDRAR